MEPDEAITNIIPKVADHLKQFENRAQKLYDKKCRPQELEDILRKAMDYVNQAWRKEMYGDRVMSSSYRMSIGLVEDEALRIPSIRYIMLLLGGRNKEMRTMTVGDLREMLEKFPQDRPVKIKVWIADNSSDGTDWSAYENRAVTDIVDLDTRVEIVLDHFAED